ncbi:hypothetical protein [Actinokineospora pegani]|uniref:hypothetical protein n=1 Tax=Actinokineospora pegani TaxID=2654637 RepID=UPI0012EA2001|nr:hypothetical protein [Actinokineospora pegani]
MPQDSIIVGGQRVAVEYAHSLLSYAGAGRLFSDHHTAWAETESGLLRRYFAHACEVARLLRQTGNLVLDHSGLMTRLSEDGERAQVVPVALSRSGRDLLDALDVDSLG